MATLILRALGPRRSWRRLPPRAPLPAGAWLLHTLAVLWLGHRVAGLLVSNLRSVSPQSRM